MKHDPQPSQEYAAPRFASAWAALTYAACAVSLAWPAFLGRSLLDVSSDQFRAGYSFRSFAATYFREHGGFPLWNPYLQGGMPFVGAMHGDTFYPTFLLRLIMPVDVAIVWGMIGHYFLCGFATYWFLRIAARLSFSAALIGGVAYMMTGFVSSLISPGHDGKLFVNALFPVILIVLTWAVRDGKQWAFGALAAIVGLTLLTPHPQLFEQAMVIAGGWALFLAFGGKGTGQLSRREAVQRLGAAALAVGVGVAISAIQYMPAAEYTPWSPRAQGLGYERATSFSFPIEELFNLYLPQFSGILGDYWGRNFIHFHSEYAGVAVLMLAGAAFGATMGDVTRRFVRFWIGAGLFALFWALGGHTPFFKIIYAVVPMVKYMRAPSTMFFVTAFAIAVLAAVGAQRVLDRHVSRRYLAGWLIASAVITLLAFSGALSNIASSLVTIPQFLDRVDAGAGALRIGALRAFVFVIAAAATVHLIGQGRLKAWAACAALVVVCAADLWTVDRLYWRWGPSGRELFASDPAIDYLRRVQEPARVLAFEDGGQPVGENDPYLNWDGLMAHDVRLMLGYHGNEIGRYQLFGEQTMATNPTAWALTNTRFILTNNDSLDIPGGRRVVGPVRNSAGTMVSLYELPGDNRFAWVAPAIVKYPDDQLAEQLRAPNFPVHSIALIDPASITTAVNLSALPAPLNIGVTTTTYEPGRIALTLGSPAPAGSALVVSENYYPGWIATVDGAPATAERANFSLMAVALPAGATKVELTFTSPVYEQGKAITLVSIALSILWMLAGAIFDRRKSTVAA